MGSSCSNKVTDYKTQGEWKIHLSMTINFVPDKDFDEIRTMHIKGDNIYVMMGNETDEANKELFESLLPRYQEGLEESMKVSVFVFDSIDLLEYKFNKIGLNRGGAYVDSPKQLKDKKATINPKCDYGKCFQYLLTVALNYQNIKSYPERISNIKPFIDQYDWKEINFPTQQKDQKKFELSNNSIAINVLFVPYNAEKIRFACKSKYNFKRENQVILVMITDGKKWHYLAVKSLSALLRGIALNHNGDFYCLNCFHLYRTKKTQET